MVKPTKRQPTHRNIPRGACPHGFLPHRCLICPQFPVSKAEEKPPKPSPEPLAWRGTEPASPYTDHDRRLMANGYQPSHGPNCCCPFC